MGIRNGRLIGTRSARALSFLVMLTCLPSCGVYQQMRPTPGLPRQVEGFTFGTHYDEVSRQFPGFPKDLERVYDWRRGRTFLEGKLERTDSGGGTEVYLLRFEPESGELYEIATAREFASSAEVRSYADCIHRKHGKYFKRRSVRGHWEVDTWWNDDVEVEIMVVVEPEHYYVEKLLRDCRWWSIRR